MVGDKYIKGCSCGNCSHDETYNFDTYAISDVKSRIKSMQRNSTAYFL